MRIARGLLLGSTFPLIAITMASAGSSLRPSSSSAGELLERALDQYAAGAIEEAVASIAGLDARARESPRFEHALRRARRRVEAQLERRSAADLFELAALEQRVVSAHADAGHDRLADRAVERALAAIEAHLRGAGDSSLGAALLVSLAGRLHARSLELEAEPVYRRALALDPEQPAALLGLAAVEEKRGRLEAAAELLARLSTLAPLEREIRLRSALVRLRLDDRRGALVGLDELVAEGGDDWIAALAHQERAKLLASLDRFDEALACAREGLRAVPCDPSLSIVASYVAEGAGRQSPDLGNALVECAERAREPAPESGSSLARESSRVRESSRAVYNRRPTAFFDALRARIETVERERLASLATALGRSSR